MASVADILFGNKKRVIETGQKAKSRENQFDDNDEVSKRPLTQDRINQLLGKKTNQVKNQISESKLWPISTITLLISLLLKKKFRNLIQLGPQAHSLIKIDQIKWAKLKFHRK